LFLLTEAAVDPGVVGVGAADDDHDWPLINAGVFGAVWGDRPIDAAQMVSIGSGPG
jgi:hypothetical protein